MGKAKKHSPEKTLNILRQIEVASANGKHHPLVFPVSVPKNAAGSGSLLGPGRRGQGTRCQSL